MSAAPAGRGGAKTANAGRRSKVKKKRVRNLVFPRRAAVFSPSRRLSLKPDSPLFFNRNSIKFASRK
jgi:hypothetical protein